MLANYIETRCFVKLVGPMKQWKVFILLSNILSDCIVVVPLLDNILLVYKSTDFFHQIYMKVILQIISFWTDKEVIVNVFPYNIKHQL